MLLNGSTLFPCAADKHGQWAKSSWTARLYWFLHCSQVLDGIADGVSALVTAQSLFPRREGKCDPQRLLHPTNWGKEGSRHICLRRECTLCVLNPDSGHCAGGEFLSRNFPCSCFARFEAELSLWFLLWQDMQSQRACSCCITCWDTLSVPWRACSWGRRVRQWEVENQRHTVVHFISPWLAGGCLFHLCYTLYLVPVHYLLMSVSLGLLWGSAWDPKAAWMYRPSKYLPIAALLPLSQEMHVSSPAQRTEGQHSETRKFCFPGRKRKFASLPSSKFWKLPFLLAQREGGNVQLFIPPKGSIDLGERNREIAVVWGTCNAIWVI